MKRLLKPILLLVFALPVTAMSQQILQPDSLLNKLSGKWLLKGTIDGKEANHDIEAGRVLDGQYLQLKEVSREKNTAGKPVYEAVVYICWQEAKKEYYCLWLDNTSNEGITNGIVGHAKQNGDKIEFLFRYSDSTQFHNTFLYDRAADTWQWIMDGDENGKLQPFARVKMTKKGRDNQKREYMFTIAQIEAAHSKVKSGADFPVYIQEIKRLGVKGFETWVVDSHTEYFGENNYIVKSEPQYDNLPIAGGSDKEMFNHKLKDHQRGETDYFTFCLDCAQTGIEKWIVDLNVMTCIYYNKAGTEILTEQIPG